METMLKEKPAASNYVALSQLQVKEIEKILSNAKASLPPEWGIWTNNLSNGSIELSLGLPSAGFLPPVPANFVGKPESFYFKNHEKVMAAVGDKLKEFGLLRSQYEITYYEPECRINISIKGENREPREMKNTSNKELVEAIPEMRPQKEDDINRLVSTPQELKEKMTIAENYRPSSFMSKLFEIDSASPEQKKIAIIELGYLINEIGERINKNKPKNPVETLNLIHDYIHNEYKFNTQHNRSIVNGLVNHRFDCDIASKLFFEVGQKYNLPIEMREVKAYPINHMFIRWEQNGNELLWEPLAVHTPRIYKSFEDVISRLKDVDSYAIVSYSLPFTPNDVLSDAYLFRAQELIDRSKKLEEKPLDKRSPTIIKLKEYVEKALELNPDNAVAYILLGDNGFIQ